MSKKSILTLAVASLACIVAGVVQAAPYRAESVTVLHDKKIGAIKGAHYLPSTPKTVIWGRLPNRKTKPVEKIPSGSTITIDTVSHEGILEDQSKDPVKYFGQYGIKKEDVLKDAIAITKSKVPHDFDKDGPHIVTGPVYVEGAAPGDVLKVEVLDLVPRVPYGVISNRHFKGALVGEFPEGTPRQENPDAAHPERYGNVSIFTPIKRIDGKWYGFLKEAGQEIRFPISPFVGIMGVTPDTDESWSSVPPARIGGNIDINELGVGATLYLPVEVEGANFYAGDPHFVQGDGEVALTALEGSLRATFRLTVIKKGSEGIPKTNADNLVKPFAETGDYWIPIGLNEDLDEAMKDSVRESISFLAKQLGIARKVAYAYLSAAADYEVSQVVDKTKGIHALIPKVDFADFLNLAVVVGKDEIPVVPRSDGFYISAEKISNAFGLKYAVADGKLSIGLPDKTVSVPLGSNNYQVGGETVMLDKSPLQTADGVLLPVSALSEVLGVSINWSTVGKKLIGQAQRL